MISPLILKINDKKFYHTFDSSEWIESLDVIQNANKYFLFKFSLNRTFEEGKKNDTLNTIKLAQSTD